MADDEIRRLSRLAPNLKRRARILRSVRSFFDNQGFLEIETPLRSPAIAPEKEIVPFESEGWFLSTSPELYMKRLLAAGYREIYQVGHSFRKGEFGNLHNPEFTMLEWYRAGADYLKMMDDTEKLVCHIASELGVGLAISYRGETIDLTPPWDKVTIRQVYTELAGWDPVAVHDPARFDMDMVTRVVPFLNPRRPTILIDYPAPMASLARLKRREQGVAERAEVFIGGLELANAYSELTDAVEQEKRFREEIREIQRKGDRLAPLPERFLKALPHLPECAGIALGIDRLVMLFCDIAEIGEVMPFTAETA